LGRFYLSVSIILQRFMKISQYHSKQVDELGQFPVVVIST
jgi:hypothetical protein